MKLALLLAPLLCGFTVVSAPPSNAPAVWSPAGVTITYPTAHPTDITDGSDVTAIQSAFAAWNGASCSTFRYTSGGAVVSASSNTIQYVTNSGDFADSAVLAYTVRSRSDVNWTSAVVRMNDFAFHWATTGKLYLDDDATKAYDFQSTLTHELGHALGLGHSPDPEATMYFGGREGRTYFRTLGADDIKGVCYLYPKSSIECSTNADCPLQDTTEGGAAEVTICSNSACVAGKRTYGQDCFASSDCTTSMCTRFDADAVGSDPGQCTQNCACSGSNCATCPGGDICNGTVCAPRAADCAPGCTGYYACLPDVDGDFTCTLHCTLPGHPCDMTDEVCFNGPDDAHPGLCRTPGPKKTGLLCDAPSECASLVCNSGTEGRQTCVGTELAPPTILTDPPPPPPDDSGPMDDGGGGGDTDGSSDSDGFVDQGDAPLNDAGDGRVRSGCTEAAPSFMVVAFAVLIALRSRRC